MDKKMEEYLKQEIMGQSRHQFIYGYDGLDRKQFLENLADDYPIKLDQNAKMAIYVKDIGLPKLSTCYSEVDKMKLDRISQEFLSFSIASDILIKAKETNDIDILNEKMKNLIRTLNKVSINKNYPSIIDLDDLIKNLLQSKEFYRKYYLEYYEKGLETLSIDDILLPFISLDMFIELLKRAINNDSYFGIILDKQKDIALSSTQAINVWISRRINHNISMKVSTTPDNWDSYRDSNGIFIEGIHDYGIVELDNSYQEYRKKLKMK